MSLSVVQVPKIVYNTITKKKTMKKIAVMTFYQSNDNYGQILQCFALQRILNILGFKSYVIRYGFHQRYIHWFNLQNYFTTNGIRSLLREFKRILYNSIYSEFPDRKFNRFRCQYISFSSQCYNTLDELKMNPPKADIYIAGSDQIWAQMINKWNNRSFFLDFGKEEIRRISYAASFAVHKYPTELQEELKNLLQNFDAISVRENTGVDICKKIGFDAKLVLDPTLLPDVTLYNQMAEDVKKRNYCFVYHVNVTAAEELSWDNAKKYNITNSLTAYAVFANPQKDINMQFLDNVEYIFPTIQQWLGWIKHAQYVLTSSFHGMVFSIIFHVPFVVCLRQESMYAGNDRVISFLKAIGLEDNILSPVNTIDKILSRKINWAKVEKAIAPLRTTSLFFLESNLIHIDSNERTI